MSAYDLDAKADAAEELAPISLGGSGYIITLSWETGATYITYTGKPSGSTAGPYTSSGIEISRVEQDRPGTLVKAGDIKFMLSPLQTDGSDMPEVPVRATATLGGVDYTVTGVEPYKPAGNVVFTYLYLGK